MRFLKNHKNHSLLKKIRQPILSFRNGTEEQEKNYIPATYQPKNQPWTQYQDQQTGMKPLRRA
jgi:hypothetical protein